MALVIFLFVIGCLPLAQSFVFRVSALFVFVSVTAGALLVQFVGDDAGLAASAFIKGQGGAMAAQLFLLLLPFALTVLFLPRTLPKSKFMLHIVPLIAIGATLVVFVVPLLPSSAQKQVFSSHATGSLIKSQDLIVGATCLSVLSLMWSTNRHHEARHGKHHK